MKTLLRALILLSGLLPIAHSVTLAQRLADPNWVDLTPYLETIDSTDINTFLYEPRNIGDQNSDGVDDLYLRGQTTGDSVEITNHLGLLRSDGTLSRLPLNIENFILAADIDADGRKDIFDYVQGFQFRYLLHHAAAMLSDNDTLRFADGDGRAILVDDLNEDGQPDLLTDYNGSTLALYKGPVAVNTVLRPDDSVRTSTQQYYSYNLLTAVGRFLPDHKPRLFALTSADTGNWNWRLTASLFPPLSTVNSLWDATPSVVFRDSVQRDVFVYTTPSLVCDLTGDGLDDFIVTDSAHIYVFAGGPEFGSRPLSKDEVTLVLTSPALLDSGRYKFLNWPIWLSFAGDITGTGVPYLAVGGWLQDTSIVLFYAGGSAIDQYYDAALYMPSSGSVNYTPVAIGQDRDAGLLTTRTGTGSRILYLDAGTELIPHVQRSDVRVGTAAMESLSARYREDGTIVFRFPEKSRRISIYNTLGVRVLEAPVESSQFVLPPGTIIPAIYWVQTDASVDVVKVIVR